jgi:CRISPR-associated exonuclease Cas4
LESAHFLEQRDKNTCVTEMYSEEELLPLSSLQHLVFCERQWALIHLEQQWAENELTAEGRNLHERADEGADEWRDGVRICRGVRLRSLRLGLVGRADVVEFRPTAEGPMQPYPVEYKRGRPKPDRCDEVQLCAQALCLEEMLQRPVPAGAIFYGQPRRRADVTVDAQLRRETESLALRLHELHATGETPRVPYQKKCDRCSLYSICLPKSTAEKSVKRYLARAVAAAIAGKSE